MAANSTGWPVGARPSIGPARGEDALPGSRMVSPTMTIDPEITAHYELGVERDRLRIAAEG